MEMKEEAAWNREGARSDSATSEGDQGEGGGKLGIEGGHRTPKAQEGAGVVSRLRRPRWPLDP